MAVEHENIGVINVSRPIYENIPNIYSVLAQNY